MKRIKRYKLNECFDGQQFFITLYGQLSSDPPEWLADITSAALLDFIYHYNYSGDKAVSPLINKYIKDNETASLPVPYHITLVQKKQLADICYKLFQNKWEKLWAVVKSQYNPIENYNMEQTETPSIYKTHTSDNYKITDTRTTNVDVTVDTNADTYGFNSENSVPVGYNSTHTLADNDDNIETTEREESGAYTDSETGTRKLERNGNIGVTTNQQMLESEIKLWQWNFYENVFEDIDSVLTLPIYIN